jgi:hypothetical protein
MMCSTYNQYMQETTLTNRMLFETAVSSFVANTFKNNKYAGLEYGNMV